MADWKSNLIMITGSFVLVLCLLFFSLYEILKIISNECKPKCFSTIAFHAGACWTVEELINFKPSYNHVYMWMRRWGWVEVLSCAVTNILSPILVYSLSNVSSRSQSSLRAWLKLSNRLLWLFYREPEFQGFFEKKQNIFFYLLKVVIAQALKWRLVCISSET